MLTRSHSAKLRLGLATVMLTCLGQASSVLDTQPAGQLAPSSWLEPLVLDGPPHDGVLGVKGDQDYFSIDVTEPTLAEISAFSISWIDGLETEAILLDPDGGEIASDGGREEGGFLIVTFLPRRGTYYLVVSGTTSGSYTLRAERRESPIPLPLGGPPQEKAISTEGEVGYFGLDVTEPTLATIYTSGDVDTSGVLLDPDGREIASDDRPDRFGNFRVDAFLPSRGTYYLRVQQYPTAGRTGSYALHAERRESSSSLRLGGPPQEGAISTEGEVDYFWLDVTEPTSAAIYTSGDIDTLGALFDQDGREVARDYYGGERGNFRIDTVLPHRGTYYLKVWRSHSSTATGSYTLHAEQGESPRPLQLGGPLRQGAIMTEGEVDYFRLEVTEPARAAIYTSGGLSTKGVLLDPDGREIASYYDAVEGAPSRIDTVLFRRGTYYLKVQPSFPTTATGSYTLHAERLGSPGPLLLGGPPQDGASLMDGEEDFFWLDVTEPIKVAIHTSGGVDTGGELYDPDRELIAWDDDGGGGNNFRIDTALFRRGTHLLRILSSNPASTGSYSLHAEGSVGGPATTGGSGGLISPAAAEFDLDPDNDRPRGIAFANGRLHVVDSDDDKVYVYDLSGQRVPAADFDLQEGNADGQGMTFANGRLHVLDGAGYGVLVFDTSGRRVPAAEFDLDSDNDDPLGMTFANGRLYVVDDYDLLFNSPDGKVYAYQASGRRIPAAEFDLDPGNDDPFGMTFAYGRFYVVDFIDEKAYAYQASGQRVPSADFDLEPNNGFPSGITFGNGRFYVVDGSSHKVFTYQ